MEVYDVASVQRGQTRQEFDLPGDEVVWVGSYLPERTGASYPARESLRENSTPSNSALIVMEDFDVASSSVVKPGVVKPGRNLTYQASFPLFDMQHLNTLHSATVAT